MKSKYIAIGLSAALLCSVTLRSANAYTLYSESKSATYAAGDYTDELTSLNRSLNEAIEQYTLNSDESSVPPEDDAPDTAGIYDELLALAQEYHLAVQQNGIELSCKLMDYDVMLKKLRTALTRYDRRSALVRELELIVRTGDASPKELSDAKDMADAVYYEIKSILFEISTMKAEIEEITGETLKDTFDFESVYLITNAAAVSSNTLSGDEALGTIYVPVGAEGAELPKQDHTAELNGAVQAYYDLGGRLRELITAAAQEKEAGEQYLLGQLSAEGLLAVTEMREDKFLAAAEAKAELSKALLALDVSSGRGVTEDYGISDGEVTALKQTIGGRRGVGLWLVKQTKSGAALCPVSYPTDTLPKNENDQNRYTYSVYYNGKLIGSADCGTSCVLKSIEYKDGENTAVVGFYRNGSLTKRMTISIFTPYGEFLS